MADRMTAIKVKSVLCLFSFWGVPSRSFVKHRLIPPSHRVEYSLFPFSITDFHLSSCYCAEHLNVLSCLLLSLGKLPPSKYCGSWTFSARRSSPPNSWPVLRKRLRLAFCCLRALKVNASFLPFSLPSVSLWSFNVFQK